MTFTARRAADGPLAAEVDRVLGNELAAAINHPDQDLKGESVMFLPQGATPIRAVIVAIGWGLGFDVYLDQRVRRFAADSRLAVMRVSVRHIAEPNANLIGPGRIPPVAGARIRHEPVATIRRQTGRGELASAPLLLWGHSAGGGLVAGLATNLRERVIGLVRYHSGGAGGDLKVLTQLPALILVGGKDPGNGGDARLMVLGYPRRRRSLDFWHRAASHPSRPQRLGGGESSACQLDVCRYATTDRSRRTSIASGNGRRHMVWRSEHRSNCPRSLFHRRQSQGVLVTR